MTRRISIVAAVIGILLLSSCGESAPKNNALEFSFDSSNVPELEIKGTLPDGTSSWSGITIPAKPAADEKLLAHGRELYAKACAACHGVEGKGDGPLPTKLNFNSFPANFTIPIRSIKVRSTAYGSVPIDEDLFRTITRGFPGTAMQSYSGLSEADRWALVFRIKEFWPKEKLKPPELVKVPPKPGDPDLAEGRNIFTKYCANCHGQQALTITSSAAFNQSTGKPYPGIAFARGGGKYMFTGNSDEDIARTLLTGLSTTSPMMSFQAIIYGEEPNARELEAGHRKLWGTVLYTRQLIEAQNGK